MFFPLATAADMVLRQLKALHVKPYIATNSPDFLDERTGELKPEVQERAKLYDCRLVTGKDLVRLAEVPEVETIRTLFGW